MFLPRGKSSPVSGFTLIELSIVLVIIGLIIGGVLVGQDMIRSAEERAQISQIEKYNSAVNTFVGKYGALPGDMLATVGIQFGFTQGVSCDGSAVGRRNGNGLIEGYMNGEIVVQGEGETALFWEDLSSPIAGGFIDGSFAGASAPQAIVCNGIAVVLSSTNLNLYFPLAKIGHGNYVYVYPYNSVNWYGVSAITSVNVNGEVFSGANISVKQAYDIDRKMDDGLPLSGKVQAIYVNSGPMLTPSQAPSGTSDTTGTCYNTASGTYSISTSAGYGANGNCALSFQFQ